MHACKGNWENLQATVKQWEDHVSIVGTEDNNIIRPIDLMWQLRGLYVTVATNADPHLQHAFHFPEASEMAMMGVNGTPRHFHGLNLAGYPSLLFQALALERLGRSDAAMACAAMVVEPDMALGGNPNQWATSVAHRCRGRLLAKQGRMSDAISEFEASIAVAAGRGYRGLEAMALRELIAHASPASAASRTAGSGGRGEGRTRLQRMMVDLSLSESELDALCVLKTEAESPAVYETNDL